MIATPAAHELTELLDGVLAEQLPQGAREALTRAAAIAWTITGQIRPGEEAAPVVFPMSREQRDRIVELIAQHPEDEFWIDVESTPAEVYLRQLTAEGQDLTHSLEARPVPPRFAIGQSVLVENELTGTTDPDPFRVDRIERMPITGHPVYVLATERLPGRRIRLYEHQLTPTP